MNIIWLWFNEEKWFFILKNLSKHYIENIFKYSAPFQVTKMYLLNIACFFELQVYFIYLIYEINPQTFNILYLHITRFLHFICSLYMASLHKGVLCNFIYVLNLLISTPVACYLNCSCSKRVCAGNRSGDKESYMSGIGNLHGVDGWSFLSY